MSQSSGGLPTVKVRARIRRSKNEDVFIVQINAPGLVEPATFYASEDDVAPTTANGHEVEGTVRALLLKEREDGQVVVLIPGDAVSYGPQMVLPGSLLAG